MKNVITDPRLGEAVLATEFGRALPCAFVRAAGVQGVAPLLF